MATPDEKKADPPRAPPQYVYWVTISRDDGKYTFLSRNRQSVLDHYVSEMAEGFSDWVCRVCVPGQKYDYQPGLDNSYDDPIELPEVAESSPRPKGDIFLVCDWADAACDMEDYALFDSRAEAERFVSSQRPAKGSVFPPIARELEGMLKLILQADEGGKYSAACRHWDSLWAKVAEAVIPRVELKVYAIPPDQQLWSGFSSVPEYADPLDLDAPKEADEPESAVHD